MRRRRVHEQRQEPRCLLEARCVTPCALCARSEQRCHSSWHSDAHANTQAARPSARSTAVTTALSRAACAGRTAAARTAATTAARRLRSRTDSVGPTAAVRWMQGRTRCCGVLEHSLTDVMWRCLQASAAWSKAARSQRMSAMATSALCTSTARAQPHSASHAHLFISMLQLEQVFASSCACAFSL